ncbi:DUF4163 domain-containing protein [Altericroceibacterium endophyticum]|uniref:DUF4163 domain-containing protein n=1 Tax=Altericroceibacterium endophyticum TaxID=1808508 RepID=A0A6I4T6D8_9SPHN|nr:DUF4163 domain-containing protein [Altericroceibacterium endophyticum]MXO66476.1 DUF4163 domain-containing protein [Altericroceibacterium endophyticum]
MKTLVSLLSLSLALTACNGAKDAAPDAQTAEATATAKAQSPDESDGGGRNVSAKTDDYEFSYEYPQQVQNIPELEAIFDSRLHDKREELQKQAAEARVDAAKNDYPFRPYSLDVEWDVVADIPAFLSLSSEYYTYTGGAHGMAVFDALVWDKQVKKALEPIEMFTSSADLADAVRSDYCAQLDKERAEKRGEPVKDDGSMFNDCIDPVENSMIIVGSSNGETFDRIGFLIPPYNAGPYAEGTYEVTLPVSAAVKALVSPKYRDAFTTGD